NIVHSDLKPANFLLVRGILKLIDFGIAKSIPNDTTNIHRDYQTGTLNYMSPEAYAASDTHTMNSRNSDIKYKLGRASDIWSLGCILYQIIYGKPPFADIPVIRKFQCIPDPKFEISYPTTSPFIEGGVVEESAINVLKKCLDRDPKKRSTINELLQHEFLGAGETRKLMEVRKVVNKVKNMPVEAGKASGLLKEMVNTLERIVQ
ncbi:hypothetical protein HK098_007863, partial [Nowakowskiella sp. JEL0407]